LVQNRSFLSPSGKRLSGLRYGRRHGHGHQNGTIALKGLDIMDTQTLLIIIVLVLLLGGGGWYGRGRWF
jgi:hypothetical protein